MQITQEYLGQPHHMVIWCRCGSYLDTDMRVENQPPAGEGDCGGPSTLRQHQP